MSEPDDPEAGGVLSSLPSTRPQRRSAKREPAKPSAGPPAKPTAGAPARRSAGPPAKPPAGAAAKKRASASAKTRTGAPAKARTGAPARRAKPERKPAPEPASRVRSALGADRRPEPAPIAAQGFEPDAAHGAVEPPSRVDLLGSVAEATGEIAHFGLGLARQLARSVLGRLPRL